jgi:hypothetical protein
LDGLTTITPAGSSAGSVLAGENGVVSTISPNEVTDSTVAVRTFRDRSASVPAPHATREDVSLLDASIGTNTTQSECARKAVGIGIVVADDVEFTAAAEKIVETLGRAHERRWNRQRVRCIRRSELNLR